MPGDKVTAVIVDHTCQVMKNYQAPEGAKHAFTVGIQDGQIAAVCMTATTRVDEIAHAVEQLAARPYFNPRVLFTDTWPNKKPFWNQVFGEDCEGKLGLFHYMKRSMETLRQGHFQYRDAVVDLRKAVYRYEENSLAGVVKALENGTLSDRAYTAKEIEEMLYTPRFKKNYEQYLMKCIHPADLIVQNLRNWFDRYKCDSSDPDNPGQGRIDPRLKAKLFTPDTKEAINSAISHAGDIQCPTNPIELHHVTQPTKGSKHGLPIILSDMNESKLECFHGKMANFANNGMRNILADFLNAKGTARWNQKIRHYRRLSSIPFAERVTQINECWANRPDFYDESLLAHLNNSLKEAGCEEDLFKNIRTLPAIDSQMELFMGYRSAQRRREQEYPKSTNTDRCMCPGCGLSTRVDTRARAKGINTSEALVFVDMDRFPKPPVTPKASSKPAPIHNKGVKVGAGDLV